MPSDDPKHVGSRLSALLGSPALQTPQPASSSTITTAVPPNQSRRSSARNSAAMGYPIYEPQSQRPYTPEPEPELEEERPEPQLGEKQQQTERDPFSSPPLPVLPTTPAPAHINPPSSQPSRQQQQDSSSPTLTTSPTLNNTPTLHHTPFSSSSPTTTTTTSNKPSFQSTRTLSSTSTSFPPYPNPPSNPNPNRLSRSHTSTNPCSPFYLHPQTRTSLEVDRAGIKSPFSASASASKTAIVSIHPVPSSSSSCGTSNNTSAADLENGAVYHHDAVIPIPQGRTPHQSCDLLRLECAKKTQRRWCWRMGRRGARKRLTARQTLWVKLLGGVVLVGGVVGLVVGLWWRFSRLAD